MGFTKIDLDTWDRKNYYTWFTTKNNCKINMTVNLDATDLIKTIKEKKLRCYPTFTYIISRVINEYDEFKMAHDENGTLGVCDVVHPRYPIFHESDKKISCLWTEYSKDFNVFYNSFTEDCAKYGENCSMEAKGEFPNNCFDMSSIPWQTFTSFGCPPCVNGIWLPPFVIVGRFFEDNGKILLPVSITVHHATCDGYHVSRFFSEVQDLCKNIDAWI